MKLFIYNYRAELVCLTTVIACISVFGVALYMDYSLESNHQKLMQQCYAETKSPQCLTHE